MSVNLSLLYLICHICLESNRCNQFLGMNDGSIGDFQLTASSEYKGYKARNARPHGSGWCMQPYDKDPFIQVACAYIISCLPQIFIAIAGA